MNFHHVNHDTIALIQFCFVVLFLRTQPSANGAVRKTLRAGLHPGPCTQHFKRQDRPYIKLYANAGFVREVVPHSQLPLRSIGW